MSFFGFRARGSARRGVLVLVALLLAIGVALMLRKRGTEEASGPGAAAAGRPAVAGPAPTGAPPKDAGAAVVVPNGTAKSATRIAGTVVHDDGTPAAGWRVTLRAENRPEAPGEFQFLRDTRTSPDGRFAFEDLSPWNVSVTAETSDRDRSPNWSGTLREGTETAGLVLRLPPVTPFVVTVVDPRGAMVEGASVQIWNAQQLGAILSAADGTARFELNGLPEVGVRADPPENGARRFLHAWGSCPASAGAIRVTLADAGVASGIVLAPDGTPAAGITVLRKDHGNIAGETVSGEDGRFECAVPLNETVVLSVEPYQKPATLRRPDGKEQRVKGELTDVRAGDSGLQLRLEWVEDGCELVIVVMSPDGNPVAGAKVLIYEQGVDNEHNAVSGDDGRATFRDLPKSGFSVAFDPPDTPEAADWMGGCEVMEEAVPGGEPFEVRLGRGCRVKGLIVLPDGSPAAGAALHLNVPSWCLSPQVPHGDYTADVEGRFSFLVSPYAARDVQLRATLAGQHLKGERAVDARALKEDVIIQLVKEP